MDNTKNSKMIYDNQEQNGNKLSKKVVIITSTDNNDEKFLSYLTSTNIETVVVNLNTQDLINQQQVSHTTLSQSKQKTSNQISKNSNTKKRKADLTCVICDGQAIGYNFAQITCESCKAFFRRNALQPIEKTKCIKQIENSNEIQCLIRYDIKHKCQRCRLLKCFQAGMRKDYILTPEEKQSKQQHLEENRRLRSLSIINQNEKNEDILKPLTTNENHLTPLNSHSSLNETDWSCLLHIQNAYNYASQSSPSASSVMSVELTDKMSAFMNIIEIENFTAVKLINFLREIPEFEQLDKDDRVILVKYNLTLLFFLWYSLTFDQTREILYENKITDAISPADEAFAQNCKSLFILCYGYEFNKSVVSILHIIVDIIQKDPITTQLLMIIMIFAKGLSADDDQEPILNDEKSVFYAQSKYVDLLFRYIMEKSSYEIVCMKITRIIEQFLKIQKISRDFQQYIKDKVDLTNINPLMKSLLRLT